MPIRTALCTAPGSIVTYFRLETGDNTTNFFTYFLISFLTSLFLVYLKPDSLIHARDSLTKRNCSKNRATLQ